MNGRAPASRSGFALITVMIFMFTLFTLALSYMDLLVTEKRQLLSSENALKADALAEAGIEETLWEYNYGGADFAGWSGTTTKSKTVNGFTDTLGNAIGNYTISVYNWSSAAPLVAVTSTLTGVSGTSTQATMKTRLEPRAAYTGAVKVQGDVTLTGNAVTDSFDSTQGAYGGSNIKQNGDVVTNGTSANIVTLTGNAMIKGDANTGSGGTVSAPSKVTGSISSNASETFTSNTVPTLLTSLPNLGSLNSDASLASGNYKYTSIDLSGNDVVTVSGSVSVYLTGTGTALGMSGNAQIQLSGGASFTLYTDGDVSLSGNGTIHYGGSQSVDSVLIYGTSTCESFTMSGNGILNGLVNAPQADVSLSGNGTLYGAVIGNEFSATGNGALHYDEQLPTSGPSSGYKLDWYRKT